jgi:hypothetical protein
MVMKWPRDWAATMGITAMAAAVAAGLAIDASTSHHAGPILDATSISRDRVATDECTDNPADPVCPPLGPTDVKCATAPWRGTAFCAGGPFAPLVVTPPPRAACPPVVVGCPGWVPNVPQPPVASSGPPSTKHEAPPPPKSPPVAPEGPAPVQPPPVAEHPEPDTPAAPVAPPPVEAPHAPVAPAPVEAPPAPVAPAPAPAPPSK